MQGCEQSASSSPPGSLERGLCTAACLRNCGRNVANETDQCTSVCVWSSGEKIPLSENFLE